jgi:membrane protein implicated in regulation of membrane protease activity
MHVPTRILEGSAAIGGGIWAVLAQANPLTVDLSPWVGFIKTLAELSPTAILAGILIVLWKRHTSREDAVQEVLVENTKALQRVADVMSRCPGHVEYKENGR